MPLYGFYCEKCKEKSRIFLLPEEYLEVRLCKKCGTTLIAAPTGPSSQVMEVLDNGLMPKKVERLRDAETLYRDRSKNHKS